MCGKHRAGHRAGHTARDTSPLKGTRMAQDNDIVVEAWNTVLFDKFCRFKHLLVEGLSAHSDEALDRQQYPSGARVLDVGCGFGDSTIEIARRLGAGGEAVGVDCARNFIAVAEADA